MTGIDWSSFLATPSVSCSPPHESTAPVTPEHEETLNELIRIFGADDYKLPGADDQPSSGLTDWEKSFLVSSWSWNLE